MKLIENQPITISIGELYNKFGRNLEYTSIKYFKDATHVEYFYLYDKQNNFICSDKQTVYLKWVAPDFSQFIFFCGEKVFCLNQSEINIAFFE